MAINENPGTLVGLEGVYDQVRLMAIGGMAEIYRGRQINLDRPVAIKRIRPELQANKDIRERFRREAKSSANLLHQNLAHVYDYKNIETESYIIMEYIDGFDLAEIIERTGSLPIDVASMIALKVLHGLSYVHSHGMIHRDIKPDNIRVSIRGEVKIMDFGIAFDPLEGNLTMPGTLIGSPHYLAPEQITGAKLGPGVDLFAFGISLYEMMTAKKPFFETQTESVYTRIQKGEYIPAENIAPEIPAFLNRVIQSCLAVNPKKRPRSAESLADSIAQFVSSQFAFNVESRIRQFLLQKNFLSGDASMIEVVEKTSPGPATRKQEIFIWARANKVLLAVIVFLTLLLAFTLLLHHRDNGAGSNSATASSTGPNAGPSGANTVGGAQPAVTGAPGTGASPEGGAKPSGATPVPPPEEKPAAKATQTPPAKKHKRHQTNF